MLHPNESPQNSLSELSFSEHANRQKRMRWYVDISSIGPDKPTHRHCIEADQWQKALQGVRAKRGLDSPFGNFSIELLDDGYRAIDPLTRTRYVVQRAPDGANVTDEPTLLASGKPPAESGLPGATPPPRDSDPKAGALARAARPRPSARGAPAARTSERGRTRGKAPSIPDDVVPRTSGSPPQAVASPAVAAPAAASPGSASPAAEPQPVAAAVPAQAVAAVDTPAPPTSPAPPRPSRPETTGQSSPPRPSHPVPSAPPVARPMQAETAFERMTGGGAFALPTKPSPTAEVPTEVLPACKVLSRRSEDPTPSSPLTYREMAMAVAETTSLRDAEAIARAQYEVVRNALAGAPKGKFIQLAVFDHEFSGKPKRVPIVTLAFKDWRDEEPVIAFPQRDGVATRRSSERPSESQEVLPPSVVEPIRPTPVIAITDEPMLVRPGPRAQQGATLLERPQGAEIPQPTPSQIQRSAKEMSGEDEHTLVKESAPPPAPSAEELSDSDIHVVEVPPAPALPHAPVLRTERIPSVPPPKGLAAQTRREPTSEPPPQVVPIPAPNNTQRMAVPANGTAELGALASPAQASPAPAPHASVPPAEGGFATRGQFPVTTAPVSQVPAAPQRPLSQPRPAYVPPSVPPPPQPAAPEQQTASPLPAGSGGLSIKSPRGRRKGGDDLITDLFEACSDLGFVHDALEGADFILDLVFESIPNTCTLISFFDINTREFVVVRQGVAASAADLLPSVLLGRTSEFTGLVQRTMRAGRATVLSAPATDIVAEDARFRSLRLAPQSLVCAPIVAGGRYLGLIEVLDPLDGAPFTDGDGHALTYIGEQFAEFLAQRDLLLDPERVTRPRLSQLPRR